MSDFTLILSFPFIVLGEAWLAASDLGWIVGHSYIAYAPLLAGNTTIVYEVNRLYPVKSHHVHRYSIMIYLKSKM